MKKGLLLSLLVVSATNFAENSFETRLGVGKVYTKGAKTDVVSATDVKLDLPFDTKAEVALTFGNHNTIFKKESGIKLSKKFGKYGTVYAAARLDNAVRLGYKNDFTPVEGLTLTGGLEAQRIYKNKELILEETDTIDRKQFQLLQRIGAFIQRDKDIIASMTDDIERMDYRLYDLWDGAGSLAEALTTKTVKPYVEAKYKQDDYEVKGKLSYVYSHDHVKGKPKAFMKSQGRHTQPEELDYKVVTRTPSVELKGYYKFKEYNTKVGAEFYFDQFNLRTRANAENAEVLRDNTFTLKNYAEYEYKKDKWTVTPRMEIQNTVSKTKADSNEKFQLFLPNKMIQTNGQPERVQTVNRSRTFVLKPSVKVNYQIEKGFDVYGKLTVNRAYHTKKSTIGTNALPVVKGNTTDANVKVGLKYTW